MAKQTSLVSVLAFLGLHQAELARIPEAVEGITVAVESYRDHPETQEAVRSQLEHLAALLRHDPDLARYIDHGAASGDSGEKES